MSKQNFNSQSGKSIVELIIVLVIIAILVSFSVAQFRQSRVYFQRQNITRALKVHLERARFDSVKRRAVDPGTSGAADNRAKITLLSATSYSVTLDLNQNGTIESADTRTIDFSGQSDAQILGNNLIYPVTIKFDQRGQITARNNSGVDISPVFTLCGYGCTLSNANPSNASVISVSPTGTVAMLPGGETMPTFQNPAVTNVNSTLNVNPCVFIGNANSNSQKCS